MFEFDQFLGFGAFFIILSIGFWLMILLTVVIIPYWIFGSTMERMKMKREAKKKNLES
ncbi:hypothetical protein JCM19294_639 [Nonlabens tegetincola]|uniref:Fumarate hydratase n=1 Tax=Nonlabens tegetincola TaxID=323273 RepID=A0A090Q5U6_9FLAO|nr:MULTISPECIES: hypothetical protein [Nonlabens]MEE2801744.1 hypothetical protein [Bacteroidota bacterium]GAK97133.1 hypothetical protein JCM19294_639 [Nonlabens tegetincola]